MITICLIIIILVCQSTPIVPQTSDYFGGYDPLSGLQLASNPLHNSVQVIDNNTAGHTYHKTPVRKLDGAVYRLEAKQACRLELSVRMPPVDMRSLIREKISHYFNGSKYKADHLNS